MKKILVLFLYGLCCNHALHATWSHKPLVYGRHSMIVTNSAPASKAAQEIFNEGGNAIDAAIAAAFVLGLTEPNASGLGGGGYAITYQRASQKITAYNGRERAPGSVKANLFKNCSLRDSFLSAKSIGVPGEVALLLSLHQHEGHLPWKKLLKPAMKIARTGFPMSPRLYGFLKQDASILLKNPEIRSVFFDSKGQVKPLGTLIKNPDYRQSLDLIANTPEAFYQGKIGNDIIKKINEQAGEPLFTKKDLKYQVNLEDPLCLPYRQYTLCTSPAESGGPTLLELLSLYSSHYFAHSPHDVSWSYQFLEACKLAFADKQKYSADPGFIPSVSSQLLNPAYLKQRAKLIGKHALKTPVQAGDLEPNYGKDRSPKSSGTTSIVIVDRLGNAISMTLSIEQPFGSHIFVDGFFLNNELTDFSHTAIDAQGKPIANAPQAHKRPSSAMSPVMVFNRKKTLIALSGSPGSQQIICYVAKSLIYMLDFKINPRDSLASGNLCSINASVQIESGTPLKKAIPALKQRGETIKVTRMPSGLTAILASKKAWLGAADPRREGLAIGH